MSFFQPLLGNHKLTATAKVIVKICEHEVSDLSLPFIMENSSCCVLYVKHSYFYFLQMNEIEVCPECYLSSCQKRDNWFCEPCVSLYPYPTVCMRVRKPAFNIF